MRTALAVVLTLVCCPTARAQGGGAAPKMYVEAVAQSAFGNVTSQSFGAEAGVTLRPRLQVFVDAGRVTDAAPAVLGSSAQTIAGFLSQSQSGVAFQVRQPVTFGEAGLRYVFPASGRLEPYVLGGAGLARVHKNVAFSIGGSDVTAGLQQYGVVLGSDLAGDETHPMFSLGGGVVWPVHRPLILDVQYRYGRVLASGAAFNISRAGIGLGVRF